MSVPSLHRESTDSLILLLCIQVRARTSAGYGPDSSPVNMSIGSGMYTVSKTSRGHCQLF